MVIADGPAASRAATFTVSFLIRRFRDDRDDSAAAEMVTDRARRICLVPAYSVGSCVNGQ